MGNPESKKSKHIFMFGRIGVVLCGILWAAVWLSGEQRWQKLTDIFRGMNLGVFAAVLCVFIIAMLLITLWQSTTTITLLLFRRGRCLHLPRFLICRILVSCVTGSLRLLQRPACWVFRRAGIKLCGSPPESSSSSQSGPHYFGIVFFNRTDHTE